MACTDRFLVRSRFRMGGAPVVRSGSRRYGPASGRRGTRRGAAARPAVNLKGMFLFARAVIPHMIAAGGGAIVNTASTSSYGNRNLVAY